METNQGTNAEVEANRVLEYYKKYSLNPDLVKYFTGPEASFVEKIPKNITSEQSPPKVISPKENPSCVTEVPGNSSSKGQSPTSLEIEINLTSEQEVEEKNHSRSSSVASNKIEWDNGADIGYKNSYKFASRKSASFPSLLTNNLSVTSNAHHKVIQEKSAADNIQDLRKMYHQLTFSTDTDNSNISKEKNVSSANSSSKSKGDNVSSTVSNKQSISSSSSHSNEKGKSSTKSSSGSEFLQRKIGNPVAYSTPHEGSSSKESTSKSSKESTSKSSTKYEGYTVTPMLTLPVKTKRNLNNDKPFILSEKKEGKEDSFPELNTLKLNVDRQKSEKKSPTFQRQVSLCLTKPISVECISLGSKESVHKVVQTSFSINKSSKCVQTEELISQDRIFATGISCRKPTQKIEYIKFTDKELRNDFIEGKPSSDKNEDKYLESSKYHSNNSDISKNSEVNHEKNPQRHPSKETQTDDLDCENIGEVQKPSTNMKDLRQDKMRDIHKPIRTPRKKKHVVSTEASSANTLSHTSDEKKSTSRTHESTSDDSANSVHEFQSEEMLLTQMISLNYSKNLNTDIKRSIDILQKLLKSKKYDQATKKHYIKKIVQKIVNSKYSDDSTSSELFKPKKASSEQKFVNKTESQPNNKGTSKLQQNLPWYPASEPIYTMPKKISKNLESYATTRKESLAVEPKPPQKDENNLNVMKNQIFQAPIKISEAQVDSIKVPLISPEDIKPTSYKDQIYKKDQPNSAKTTETRKEGPKFSSNPSSRLAFKPAIEKENRPASEGNLGGTNWRTAKTLSEKMLENRDHIDFKNGQGDYLLHVVKNERHHQLSWINNEIEHLVKLKEMLEKNPKNSRPDSRLKDVIASLLKMKVNDMKVKSSSPLQEANNNMRTSRRSEYSSGELQTQDEAPSMRSNTPPKSPCTRTDKRQPDIQVYTCTTERSSGMKQTDFTEQKKCGCSFESCKCSQTTTHEEKDVQCPAFRQCTCQTEPKEDANVQCNCKDNAGVSCECAKIQQEQEDPCQCKKSSSSSSSTSDSGSGSFMSCICCKKEKILKNLISRIPLCDPCQQVNQKNFYPHNYSDPLHSCICYNLVNRDVLFQFKQTLTDLERLDIYQQYCEVLKNCKCCKKCGCKCKLPKKYKNGCAYFLKLEDACPNKHCEEEGTNSDSIYEEEEEDESDNYLPEVTVKVPNCRGSCARKKNNGEKHETKKYMSCPSIQNYLCTMKPDFVARAERRRRILREATSQREENSDNRKLNFIEKINYLSQKKRNDKINSENNGFKPCGYQAKTYCVFDIELTDSPKMVRPRVFKSFKEMKDLTRRRYLHLTEVKSKKNIYREKRLKEANRLLANTFTRRLQRSTLKGNVDIPLNVKVVSY